ncbi:unnamed protein product, partial [marine sediment metagenome]
MLISLSTPFIDTFKLLFDVVIVNVPKIFFADVDEPNLSLVQISKSVPTDVDFDQPLDGIIAANSRLKINDGRLIVEESASTVLDIPIIP